MRGRGTVSNRSAKSSIQFAGVPVTEIYVECLYILGSY